MGPSVKHVLEVLEWFYMLTEKILFQNRCLPFFSFFFTMVHRSVSDIVRRVHPSFWAEEPPLEKLQLSSTVYNPAHFPQTNLDLTCFLKIVMEESKVYFVCLLNQSSTWNDNLNICVNLNNFEFLCIYLFNCYLLVFYLKDGGLDSAAREHSLPTSGARPSYRLPPPSLIKRFST